MARKKTKITAAKWLTILGAIGATITLMAYLEQQQKTEEEEAKAPASIYAPSLNWIAAIGWVFI